jgi:CRP/FNR family transcriptional regulator
MGTRLPSDLRRSGTGKGFGQVDQVPKRASSGIQRESSHRGLTPSISVAPFDATDLLGRKRLTLRDRNHLATIATRLRVRAGTLIYSRGDPATAVYNIVEGAVTSFRPVDAEERRVMAFLFAEDVFGLARGGIYVNSAQALTPVTVFRIPIDALKTMLLRNAQLQLHFLCKVTHALRESQRHAVLLGCRDPVIRLGRFLSMLEQAQSEQQQGIISMPMTRRDIADYLNLTPAVLGHAFDHLEVQRVAVRTDPHHLRIADRRAFQALIGEA